MQVTYCRFARFKLKIKYTKYKRYTQALNKRNNPKSVILSAKVTSKRVYVVKAVARTKTIRNMSILKYYIHIYII